MTNAEVLKFARALTIWATKNAQRESPLLYPDPAHYVFWEPLLDFVAEELGVSKETVGAWVDEAVVDSKVKP